MEKEKIEGKINDFHEEEMKIVRRIKTSADVIESQENVSNSSKKFNSSGKKTNGDFKK